MALVVYPFAVAGGVYLLMGLGVGVAAYLIVLFTTHALDVDETALLAPLLPRRFAAMRVRP